MVDRGRRDDLGLIAAIAGSVAVHVGGALVLSTLMDRAPGQGIARLSVQRPPEPELGIERSEAVTMTWLGFETPTRHQATKAETAQPLETRAGPVEPSPSPSPSSSPRRQTAASQSPQSTAQDQPPSSFASQAASVQESSPSENKRDGASSRDAEERDSGSGSGPLPPPAVRAEAGPPRGSDQNASGERDADSEQAGESERERQQARSERDGGSATESGTDSKAGSAASESDRSQPRTAAPASGQRPSRDSSPSDRESAPSSTDDPIEFSPGRPVAAEGLEIKTRVPPRHSIVTRLTALARRPVFELSFARDGSVTWVRTVRSSGDPDVDQPWINALYKWKASGEALEALPKDDPDAVIKRRIELVPLQ